MATENIRIDYEVTGKKELDAANKSLAETAKINDVTQKEIDQTNKSLEEQDKQVSKTSKAFTSLGTQLTATANRFTIAGKGAGDLASGLVGVSKGAGTASKSMKILKVAIASTGIGVLVVALGSLVSFFTKTQRGANIVSKAMAGIGATVDVLIDRLSIFGEGLFKIVSGDFTAGLDLLKGSFQGITAEIKEEASAAVDLSERYEALRVAEAKLTVETAKRRAEIKKLNKDAEDTTLSEQERFAAADKAIQTEQKLQKERIALQKERLDITKEQNELSEGTTEDLIAEAEAEAALFNIQTESEEMITTLQNKRNILANTIKAQTEATIALTAAEQEQLKQQQDSIIELDEIKSKALEEESERRIEFEKVTVDAINQTNQESKDFKSKLTEAEQIEAQNASKQSLALLKQVAGERSVIGKSAALAQAGINVSEGITKALAAAPPPFNTFLAAITAAAGAVQISKITGIQLPKFEKGGRIGGKMHSQGGTLIEAELGEHVMNRKATNLYGHNIFDKINNLELDPNILNGKTGGSSTVVVDTNPIANQLKSMPQNMVNIDERGFYIHQSRQNATTIKKANRYST